MRQSFLILIIALLCNVACFADDLASGEYACQIDGSPAVIGQCVPDHLFIRSDYNDTGEMLQYDNVVSFKSGAIQTVWLWLDDDVIYLNERVQALPPIAVNATGTEFYNEVTYNALQCDIYLPMQMRLIAVENEYGDEVLFEQGDRLPNTSDVKYQEHENKVVDGITYRVYTLIISSNFDYGCHFSGKNLKSYRDNGALKKDDAPLLALYIQNDEQNVIQGRLPDMILANQEFGLIEPLLVVPKWEPNDYRFIYGEGGNNVTQRFQYYNRVALFDAAGINEDINLKGDVNCDGIVSIDDVATLIDYLLEGAVTPFNAQVADTNSDGHITIDDLTVLIDYLLNDEWPM